jgi:hypothetical protein
MKIHKYPNLNFLLSLIKIWVVRFRNFRLQISKVLARLAISWLEQHDQKKGDLPKD